MKKALIFALFGLTVSVFVALAIASQMRTSNTPGLQIGHESRNVPAAAEQQRAKTDFLLGQTEKLSEEFKRDPYKYAFFMRRLCVASADIHSPKTEERCNRAYSVAADSGIKTCDREHLQSAAVLNIAKVNPALAQQIGAIEPSHCTDEEAKVWREGREE